MMQLGEDSVHSPTPTVTLQRTTILRGFPPLPTMGGNHLDVIALGPGGPSQVGPYNNAFRLASVVLSLLLQAARRQQ